MKLNEMPKVIVNKIVNTSIIGVGFLLIGTPFSIYLKDKVFLWLTLVGFILFLVQAIDMYFIGLTKNYQVVEMTCIKIDYKFLGKFHYYVFEKNNDAEVLEIKLNKSHKFCTNTKYKLYFKHTQFLENQSFIGYEIINCK